MTRSHLLPLMMIGVALHSGAIAHALQFTDVTVAAGVSYQQGPPSDPLVGAEVTSMTGGAAAGDYDGDGFVDLFVTRTDNHDLLFRNKGDGTFEDATASAFGANPINHATNGAAWADIDNDGDLDLYTTAVGEQRHLLYVNDGGSFTEVAVDRGAAIGGAGKRSSAPGSRSATTTETGTWTPTSRNGGLPRSTARSAAPCCATRARRSPDTSRTPRRARTHWSRAPRPPPSLSLTHSPRVSPIWTATATPISRSRATSTPVAFFWNEGDGSTPRFTDGTVAAGVFTGQNDMGSAIGDVNGDGLLDWFITDIHFDGAASAHPNGNRLFLNQGDRTFLDATDTAGVRDGDWGWGAALADFDLDGDLDLTMTNGFLDGDQFLNDPMRLWENDGAGVFTEVSAAAGITEDRQGRGLLTFDYDNDGDLDVFVVNNGDQPALLRNDTVTSDGYLKIKAIGVESNRSGIGAQVIVTPDLDSPDDKMIREIDAGSNYLAQSESIAHFGVGDATTIDEVMILWPSGYHQRLTDLPVDSVVTVTETPADFNGDGVVNAADYTAWRDAQNADRGTDHGRRRRQRSRRRRRFQHVARRLRRDRLPRRDRTGGADPRTRHRHPLGGDRLPWPRRRAG